MAHDHNVNPNAPLEYQSETGRLNITGFWTFLGAEIALFSTLFASYFALQSRVGDGPTSIEMFEAGLVMIMTMLLLTSSFTCGIAIHEMRANNVKGVIAWMIITLILGAGFIGYELYEFVHYVHEGVTLGTSAHWSMFFILLGTHGLHVSIGIGWIILLLIQLARRGLTPKTASKVFISSLYWHFLDVVWIFIFTCVYLMGMVN